jgi:Uma2 family endonuclease
MALRTVAPWAEPVPEQAALMTAEDLRRRRDDGWLYELVEGRLVRMTPAGFDHGMLELDLGSELRAFVVANALGSVATGEPGFTLSRPGEPDTVLGADIAFVRAERLPAPGSPERQGFLRLAPDLVVEVASPGQYHPEMAEKARIWLAAGVRLLWLIWPRSKQVEVWRPGSDEPVATLGLADALDGMDVVPGFTYSVARLFA